MSEYKLSGKLTVFIETDLVYAEDDTEVPTASTLAFLLDEDLKNLGYDVGNVNVKNFKYNLIVEG